MPSLRYPVLTTAIVGNYIQPIRTHNCVVKVTLKLRCAEFRNFIVLRARTPAPSSVLKSRSLFSNPFPPDYLRIVIIRVLKVHLSSRRRPGARTRAKPNSAAQCSQVGAGINLILPSPNHSRGPSQSLKILTSAQRRTSHTRYIQKRKTTQYAICIPALHDQFHWGYITKSSQISYFAQTRWGRRGTQKVDSEPPRALAQARMYEAGESNALGTSTAARMDCIGRDFGGSGGMKVKHSARVLGPASVQGSRKRRSMSKRKPPKDGTHWVHEHRYPDSALGWSAERSRTSRDSEVDVVMAGAGVAGTARPMWR
ncbi:hypothetical protein B0H13DRAFT_1887788 [Mycena leptocephala]|nr:hypothetical protein B0H13DRAFT_1887788 [Mycena leptocephala]